MAICTQCGYILHADDVKGHVCASADLPKSGKPLKPTTSEAIVEVSADGG